MGNLMAMIFRTQSTSVYRTYCGSYVTFCLFSESRATSLNEAQSICTQINANSWPAEPSDKETQQVFHDYIHNYSIDNVILNAVKKNASWFWIKAAEKIRKFENTKAENDLLVYNKDPSVPNYSVVCMLECKSTWKDFSNSGANLSRIFQLKTPVGLQSCKDACENLDECTSVDMPSVAFHWTECWLYGHPYDSEKVRKRNGSHHVIDRSSKTVERCIGDYKGKKTEPCKRRYSYSSVLVRC